MAINPRSFVHVGQGAYISRSEPGEVSPIYTIARAATRLAEDGTRVRLPVGWNLDALYGIRMATGAYDERVRVTGHHAHGIAEIGQGLLKDLRGKLTSAEIEAINWLTKFLGS